VRPRVAEAVRALDELGHESLTQGLLHTDPAPEAFRLDRATGACGLIDWSTAMTGPLLYDLASAVMYVGGPDRAEPLVQAYLEQAALPRAEVERGLLVMLRFRWAVQADYFAHRIATADLTGIAGAEENEVGLEHARRMLTGPGG
jgi:homoserine kinase type II